MAGQDFNIRLGTREDMPVIMQLIKDLAIYEQVPNGPKITETDLIRDGFDTVPSWFFILVAECRTDGRLVGYAMCHRAFSSWLGRAMYMEDFYVEPQLRGHRIGHRIFKELCKMACAEKVEQIDWHVLTDNLIALEFYEKHGAYNLMSTEGRTAYRIKKPAIQSVAFGTSV